MEIKDFIVCTFRGDDKKYVAEITNVQTDSFECRFVHSGKRYSFDSNSFTVLETTGGFPIGTPLTFYQLYTNSLGDLFPLCSVVVTFADNNRYLGILNYLSPEISVTFTHSGSIYTFSQDNIILSKTTGAYNVGQNINGIELYTPGTEVKLTGTSAPTSPDSITTPGTFDQVIQIAATSAIAKYHWKDRGVAPTGYIKGMALVFARVYCKLKAGDAAATEMAKANTSDNDKDALAWYSQEFLDAGMDNDTDGINTLRHLFVLLIGLGMRESSGKYCEGRDVGASNTTADTAEAGLFQTSYNARTANVLLPQLFVEYANSTDFLDIFSEGVHCKDTAFQNFGTGDGQEFQRLSKACPAFAVEFTAIAMRNRRKHWGPINLRKAEIHTECDTMLLQVQSAIENFDLCPVVL